MFDNYSRFCGCPPTFFLNIDGKIRSSEDHKNQRLQEKILRTKYFKGLFCSLTGHKIKFIHTFLHIAILEQLTLTVAVVTESATKIGYFKIGK